MRMQAGDSPVVGHRTYTAKLQGLIPAITAHYYLLWVGFSLLRNILPAPSSLQNCNIRVISVLRPYDHRQLRPPHQSLPYRHTSKPWLRLPTYWKSFRSLGRTRVATVAAATETEVGVEGASFTGGSKEGGTEGGS